MKKIYSITEKACVFFHLNESNYKIPSVEPLFRASSDTKWLFQLKASQARDSRKRSPFHGYGMTHSTHQTEFGQRVSWQSKKKYGPAHGAQCLSSERACKILYKIEERETI